MEQIAEDAHPSRTMRALIQSSRSGPHDLALSTEEPLPVPAPDEYLVRVGVTGVNFADVMQSRGTYGGGPTPPYAAGFEAAGCIVGVGAGIAHPLPAGTHVIGTGPGAFAQYMVMPSRTVLPVPSGWSDPQAIGLILNWATALAAVKPLGDIRPGDTVLIHAAAGGVGQAAVRLAAHYGARTIAVASLEKYHVLRTLGADIILDSRSPDLAEDVRCAAGAVDLVLESVGRATFETSLAVTRPFTGRIVVFGAASGETSISTHDLVFTHHVQIKGLHIGALAAEAPSIYEDVLSELDELISAGVCPPGNPEIHPLADGPALLEQLGSGRTHGKHALDPWLDSSGTASAPSATASSTPKDAFAARRSDELRPWCHSPELPRHGHRARARPTGPGPRGFVQARRTSPSESP